MARRRCSAERSQTNRTSRWTVSPRALGVRPSRPSHDLDHDIARGREPKPSRKRRAFGGRRKQRARLRGSAVKRTPDAVEAPRYASAARRGAAHSDHADVERSVASSTGPCISSLRRRRRRTSRVRPPTPLRTLRQGRSTRPSCCRRRGLPLRGWPCSVVWRHTAVARCCRQPLNAPSLAHRQCRSVRVAVRCSATRPVDLKSVSRQCRHGGAFGDPVGLGRQCLASWDRVVVHRAGSSLVAPAWNSHRTRRVDSRVLGGRSSARPTDCRRQGARGGTVGNPSRGFSSRYDSVAAPRPLRGDIITDREARSGRAVTVPRPGRRPGSLSGVCSAATVIQAPT